MKGIDNIDSRILRDLLRDGRKDFAEIAKEIGVSKNAVWQHYSKMKKSGIITGTTVMIDTDYRAAEISAKIDIAEKLQVQELVQKIPNANLVYFDEVRRVAEIWLYFSELSEAKSAKNLLSKSSYVGEIKMSFWTTKRNLFYNLSFGLPEKSVDGVSISSAQSQQTNASLNEKSEVDETDIKIIEKLGDNGRMSFRKIAKEIGVSTDTVARKI